MATQNQTTIGDRLLSALTEIAFLGAVVLLAFKHAVGEGTITAMLTAYATGKFGVGMYKQTARFLWGPSDGSGGPPSGGSGMRWQAVQQVVPPPPTSTRSEESMVPLRPTPTPSPSPVQTPAQPPRPGITPGRYKGPEKRIVISDYRDAFRRFLTSHPSQIVVVFATLTGVILVLLERR